jgi:hypothetical protein
VLFFLIFNAALKNRENATQNSTNSKTKNKIDILNNDLLSIFSSIRCFKIAREASLLLKAKNTMKQKHDWSYDGECGKSFS